MVGSLPLAEAQRLPPGPERGIGAGATVKTHDGAKIVLCGLRCQAPAQPFTKNLVAAVSLFPKPLQHQGISARLNLPMSVAERVRQRFRAEMMDQHLSQRDLIDRLRWSQSRLAKVLTGRVELKVDDADEIARHLGLSLLEVVRDQGLEFCAELTPSELRVLQILRKRGPEAIQSVLMLTTTPAGRSPQLQNRALQSGGKGHTTSASPTAHVFTTRLDRTTAADLERIRTTFATLEAQLKALDETPVAEHRQSGSAAVPRKTKGRRARARHHRDTAG